jgi:membrane-anchored protein YejM (alkaline phosphatase superfamily)
MPTYYVSRIWSLILILALNLFVLADALSFSQYHLHIYSYLWKLFLSEGVTYLTGSQIGLSVAIVASLIIAIVIWIRGEMIWRTMQTRFSNPIKNWYLILIVASLVISKLTFLYGDVHPKLADIFPVDYNFTQKAQASHNDGRKFYYPNDSLGCQNKFNPNIIFLTIREWSQDQFSSEATPTLDHMKSHMTSYMAHHKVSLSADGGMFSLFYSLPSSYQTAAKDVRPALFQGMENRKYEMINLTASSDESNMQEFRSWISNRSGEEIQPFYLGVTFNSHASETDKLIGEIILTLEKEKLLAGSHVIITGAYSGSDSEIIPLMYASPDRKASTVTSSTSVYDVAPSLMQKAWGCKKVFKTASVGQPLDEKGRDWVLVSGGDDFKIVDFKNQNTTTVIDGKISDSTQNPRHELIFDSLRMMTSFSKSR